MPAEWLLDYISDDLVENEFPSEKGELQLYNLCKKWAEAHPGERSAEIFGNIVLKGIRFGLMSIESLINVVAKDIMIMENEKTTNLVAEIIVAKKQNRIVNVKLRGQEAGK